MKIWSLVVSVVVLLAGCAGASGTTPQQSGKLAVVASFYPLQFIAERVGGDHVNVTSLTQPGVEPHDLELAPSQVASVSKAGLVVYQKEMQPAVDKVVDSEKPRQVLEVTTVVPLHDHSDGDHADHEGHSADDGHDHEGGDPHTWLDPTTMTAYATAMATKLGEVDPANAADYQQRAAALVTELATLDQAYEKGLASCDRRTFITAHAAFSYLAERYKLEQVSIAGLSPDTEPSPARVAEVQRIAKEKGVTTIFYETLTSPAVARSIAGDLGLRTDVLDPIEGLTDQSRGKDYIAVMTANLAALRTANGCR